MGKNRFDGVAPLIEEKKAEKIKEETTTVVQVDESSLFADILKPQAKKSESRGKNYYLDEVVIKGIRDAAKTAKKSESRLVNEILGQFISLYTKK